jgi:hypothetical protein
MARAGGCGDFDDGVGQGAHGADKELYNRAIELRVGATLQFG